MISVLLVGASLSMDAFAVSVANALSLYRCGWRQAFWMGLYFGAFQFLMPLLGHFLGGTVSGKLSAFGPYISFALLAFIGGRMIWDAAACKDGACGMVKLSHPRLLGLAVATSIDALAVGVSFAFNPPVPGVFFSCALIGCLTFLISFTGAWLASRFSGIRPQKACFAGGAVLIALGIRFLAQGLM